MGSSQAQEVQEEEVLQGEGMTPQHPQDDLVLQLGSWSMESNVGGKNDRSGEARRWRPGCSQPRRALPEESGC